MSVPVFRIDRRSIATRIVSASLVALAIALVMIGGTLWLSWQLEGGAAAINDAGSLRMRTYRMALALEAQPVERARAKADIDQIDSTLASLLHGDPARPLVLPSERPIRGQYETVLRRWRTALKAQALAAANGDASAAIALKRGVDDFVGEINRLVSLIEHDNARKTDWLRLSQGVLIAIAIVGTVAMIYLLYLWIIRPVLRLQAGIGELASRRFDVRLPIETQDEFGVLARGFNAMADELQGVYGDLERRVREKTAQLAAQNLELATLYETSAFLSQPGSVEQQCRGFLQRLMQRFEAEGSSLRVLDPVDSRLHLVVAEGMGADVLNSTQCMQAHDCLCGDAVRSGVAIVRDFRKAPRHQIYKCEEAGFLGIASFRIASPQAALGSFSLHFKHEKALSPAEMQLLETLGQQLGTALENARLAARERLLAVSEERNLVARGLHDSIAQSLNFLNLQVQMLDRVLDAVPHREAAQILPLLKAGVEESYNDVRELLANFRTRLGDADIEQVLKTTVTKFRDQAGLETVFAYTGTGAPLQDEQKLQVIFILQEALSNVRKHAHATQVVVRVANEQDFTLEIQDNGCGFELNPESVQGDAGLKKVGLHIMQERAERLAAHLLIDSALGAGTRVRLVLPHDARLTA